MHSHNPTSYFKLLTLSNPKILKGIGQGYQSFILHLAPANLSGHDVCRYRTKQCAALCLNFAGRAGIFKAGETSNTIQRARVQRTLFYFQDRPAFMALLVSDIERAVRYAAKRSLVPCVRLNGTSDIPWELETCYRAGRAYKSLFYAFPAVQFYDYTKYPLDKRADARAIPNYHLTFSRAETRANKLQADKWADAGHNIAMVFKGSLPASWEGRQVFNGDQSDLRFLDPAGVIVGLLAKGHRAKRAGNGFVIDSTMGAEFP